MPDRLCDFTGLRCRVCGAPHVAERQVCGTWRPGLGDNVASALSAVGITKARAQAVAQAVGLEDCGCAHRQQLLNELGYRVGIGQLPDFNDPPPEPQSTS